MQLHFSVTWCLARSTNSNYWAREKRIIQPALLQVFVEPYSWEVEDDFHSEKTFLWTSSISSSLCMWGLLTPWMLVEIALLMKDVSKVLWWKTCYQWLNCEIFLEKSDPVVGENYSWKALSNPFGKYIQLRKEKQNRDVMDPWSGLYSQCYASQGVHQHILHIFSPQIGALVCHLSKVLVLHYAMRKICPVERQCEEEME